MVILIKLNLGDQVELIQEFVFTNKTSNIADDLGSEFHGVRLIVVAITATAASTATAAATPTAVAPTAVALTAVAITTAVALMFLMMFLLMSTTTAARGRRQLCICRNTFDLRC